MVCGSSLVHMIHVAGNDDGVGVCRGEPRDDTEANEAAAEQAKPSPAPQPAPAVKPTRPAKRPRAKPTIVHSKAVRRAVCQEMIACISGWNRARANLAVLPNVSHNRLLVTLNGSHNRLRGLSQSIATSQLSRRNRLPLQDSLRRRSGPVMHL